MRQRYDRNFLTLVSVGTTWDWRGQFPYNPPLEELKLHQKEYKAFSHVHELKSMLMQVLGVNSDGWVPINGWEEGSLALETAREDNDEALSEEDVRELWPFDGWRC